MAFPDDYHINEASCTKVQLGLHTWSTMGHPLKHRCVHCHKLKWVRNPPETEVRRSEIYLGNLSGRH